MAMGCRRIGLTEGNRGRGRGATARRRGVASFTAGAQPGGVFAWPKRPASSPAPDFVAGGQPVHIGDGVYRNRFEKRFSRHTGVDRGDGTQGYWKTEKPDGTVPSFGATAAGDLVDGARVAGRGGATFRDHLVEQVDTFGHAMRLSYRTDDELPHIDRIEYIFTGPDGGPGASLTF